MESKLGRIIDLGLSAFLLIFLSPVLIAILIILGVAFNGRPIYWSKRAGLGGDIFLMPKFRTMRLDTPEVATDLLECPRSYLVFGGSFLRKSSLDELPQLWSILRGDMSFVGPRPALHNQHELIMLRSKYGINSIRPGLTGWAQVNGRDDLTTLQKVEFDVEYLRMKSIKTDIKILALTFLQVVARKNISH